VEALALIYALSDGGAAGLPLGGPWPQSPGLEPVCLRLCGTRPHHAPTTALFPAQACARALNRRSHRLGWNALFKGQPGAGAVALSP